MDQRVKDSDIYVPEAKRPYGFRASRMTAYRAPSVKPTHGPLRISAAWAYNFFGLLRQP